MSRVRPPVLSDRALNRATLARQLLLERHRLSVPEALERVVGLQAQLPLEPYAGLWSRVAGFTTAALVTAMQERAVARLLLMRATIHLVSAADAQALRPALHGMLLNRGLGVNRRRLTGFDADDLAAAALPLFTLRPRRIPDVAGELAPRWPDAPRADLVYALGVVVPLLQVPPRGVWGQPQSPPTMTTPTAWLGPPGRPPVTPEELVVRYLRAFGPATVADIRAWSGLSGLREPVDRVRPTLRTFRDQAGRELLDTEDGVLPDPETPVPVRFLPAFDNTVLGYRHRGRVIDEDHRALSVDATRFVLVDGRVAATWTWTRPSAGTPASVAVQPLRPLRDREDDDVRAEALALEAFLSSG